MRDLLEARDAYHWTLINKANVIGTGIGLYRIRTDDPWPERSTDRRQRVRRGVVSKLARTFANSEIRDYSWPCVLVLVDEWVPADAFGVGHEQHQLDELVPRTLYLPDGRAVPVCVVQADRAEVDESTRPPRRWPRSRLGAGLPLEVEVQGQTHVASIGALVSDGHTTYALTSRHVAGPRGQVARSAVRGASVPVGRSVGRHLTRVPFGEVYPEFPAQRRTLLTLDAGLIEIDDLSDWTSRTYGLPVTGGLADLNELNISPHLIDAPVRASGAVSGPLSGRIAALCYRYNSIGGYDQVSDFLIVPDDLRKASRPGDSGTVWYLETDQNEPPQALALQWGGQALGAGGQTCTFTLAANLTNVLRLLDVDLVTDHNLGALPFWGKTGHYTIASYACPAVRTPKLRTLLVANADRISFPIEALDHSGIDNTTIAEKKAGDFLPLADVPDLIWKNLPNAVKGGRDTRPRYGPEHPCHYADIDEPRADGVTLRQLCITDADNIDVAVWQAFYHSMGHDDPKERGLLPFRVWQFFDAMVDAGANGDVARYTAAAGLVSHYVGDACQPLHGSYLSNGMPDHTGAGVHSAYEDAMVDRHDSEITAALPAAIEATERHRTYSKGHDAARAVVQLMDRTARRIDPAALVQAYSAVAKKADDLSPTVTDALWQQFGDATIASMADGTVTLATLWSSAWNTGKGGTTIRAEALVGVDTDRLRELYQDKKFVPSMDLDHVGPTLK